MTIAPFWEPPAACLPGSLLTGRRMTMRMICEPRRKSNKTFQVANFPLLRVIYCVAVFLCSAQVHAQLQRPRFTNVAEQMGIHHTYSGQFWGGGISFCDFDGDGRDDLTISSSAGESVYVFQNQGHAFVNIAAQLNLNDQFESKSILWADYDNDGDRDLLVTNMLGPSRLYRNEGNLHLVDVTAASGISTDTLPTTGACWGDFDNDGWLDLYVINYNREAPYNHERNYLYRNLGGQGNPQAGFQDVTLSAGVADSAKYPFVAVFFDYNNDRWPDIYIANDRDPRNTLFRNNGDGTFSDVSAESHSDLSFEAMGIAVGDYNDDGWFDLYVSNGPLGNGLLRNNADGTFTDVADSLSVAVGKACWGVNFFDYDNDGDLDLYVCASMGHTPGSSDRRNELFENLGNGGFTPTSGLGLDNDNYVSYGNAIGDFNDDGYADIAVLNELSNFSLWRNSPGENHWIKITLQGAAANRDGVGSLIEVYRGGSHTVRLTQCGISYDSQNSAVETIGVGSAAIIDSIIIRWPGPDYTVDVLRSVAADQLLTIAEGQTIVTGLGDDPLPSSGFSLNQNYPNPFNPSTRIRFSLFASGVADLQVFDLRGRLVKTLLRGNLNPGDHEISWDGRDDEGRPASGGIYFYRLKFSGRELTRKMLLIK